MSWTGRHVWLLLALLALAACARTPDIVPVRAADTLRVATFNVHFVDLARPEGRWSQAAWLERRGAVSATFGTLDADIVALQEAHARGVERLDRRRGPAPAWLAREHPGYSVAGLHPGGPHAQPILYRRSSFKLADEGWFYFSLTPSLRESPGLDATAPSHATWVRLRERGTGRALTVVNAHFDHRSRLSREQAARLTAGFVRPALKRGEAVVVMGDLNTRRLSEPVGILRGAGLRFPPVGGATYHFGRGIDLLGAIDHIAHGPALVAVGPPIVLRRRFEGRWPSDHHPVMLDLRWRASGRPVSRPM